MTDTPTPRTRADDLIVRLRHMGKQYGAGVVARGGEPSKHYLEESADAWEATQRDLAACRAALREQSVVDVLAERQRQIEREGWTPEHDDAHKAGELAMAGAAYAMHYYINGLPPTWPWDWSWWKPTDERRNLVKAAALILAEIDRLDRAAARAILQSDEGEGK